MSVERVKIAVQHGSLEQADAPVMVGHYENDLIASAEAFLDRCLKGALSERLSIGVYAGRLPSTEIILQEHAKPCGAVVLGLGEPGQLDQKQLFEAYLHAFTRYALSYTTHDSHHLSTILIGSKTLSLALCLQALLQAVEQSNRLLAKEGCSQLKRLDIFEIDAYTALECSDVLYQWQQAGQHNYQLELALESLPPDVLHHSRLSSPINQSSIWWQPIALEQPASGMPPVIEDLPKIRQSPIPKYLLLQVNEHSATSAWEVLLVDKQVLGEYAAVVRQFDDVPMRAVTVPNAYPQALWLEQTSSDFASLQWQCTTAKTAERALCALYANESLVWHWQGEVQASPSGCELVFDNQVITIEQLMQLPYCPELICLDLSEVSLTVGFVQMIKHYLQWGVKALVFNTQVISAKSRQQFFSVLYEQLLAGEMWGVAVQQARQQLAQFDDQAWVFQAYGQADYRLAPKQAT